MKMAQYSWLFFSVGVIFFMMGVFLLDYCGFVLEIFCAGGSSVVEGALIFCFDSVSLFFFSSVALISSVVFLYSKYYMSIEENENSDQIRFLVLLLLFVFSMFFLVFSFSWFLILLGWDGLGLVSFLLVIYYNDSKSLDSGIITVLTNRLGDCFFLLSFSFMFFSGWFSFDYMQGLSSMMVLVVILGCVTKSAQMPFSSWLPAAMAAPTPVSSLVHSSTLVTAGVFLLIRFNFLLEEGYSILGIMSLCTMVLAGIFAVYELDFKKVVAMSTLSQLGFMVFSISVGGWVFSFLHMIFHAFFKSVLFLSTGSLMHFILGNQDSRVFSSFYMSFFSKLFFSMSCLSLMGFPFSLGFYSKDSILGNFLFSGGLVKLFFCMGCCFTVAYSFRLLSLGFLSFSKFGSSLEFSEDKKFFVPVLLLFIFSVFLGDYFMFYFIFLGDSFSFLELFIGMMVMAGGLVVYFLVSLKYKVVYFFSLMMLLPEMISVLSLNFFKSFSFKDDMTWSELLSAKGLKESVEWGSYSLKFLFNLKFLYLGALVIFLGLFLN